jgi:predicted PurR-regulated permease PerM
MKDTGRADVRGGIGANRERVPIRTILVTIGLVVATVAALWLIVVCQRVLIWSAVAAFFAVALYPVVDWVQSHVARGRRAVATLIVFVLTALAIVGVVAAVAVPLARQAADAADKLPQIVEDAVAGRGPVGNLLERVNALDYVQQHQDTLRQHISDLGTPALTVVKSAVTGVAGIVTIFVLAYLMVLEGPLLTDAFLRPFSSENADRIRTVGADCTRAVSGYLSGNLVISVICGVLTYAVLKAVGAPFAGLVALFVAIVDLIPLVGATLGAIVAVAAGLVDSVTAGVVVIVFFLVYQQAENHFLQPIIYSRTVKLNPLTVVFAILVAVEVAGVLGAFLAIPTAAVIAIVVRDVWDHRSGQPKAEPTVGEERVPASRASA